MVIMERMREMIGDAWDTMLMAVAIILFLAVMLVSGF